jgi:hypothetical protein
MRVLISVLALGGGLLPLAPAAAAAPEVGTCWNLTSAQRTATRLPAATPVACDAAHTAELLGVVRGTGLTQAGAFEQCQGLGVTYVGGAPSGLSPSAYSLPRTAQLSVYVNRNGRRASCVGFSTNARGRVVARTGSVAGTGLRPRVCFNSVTWVRQKCSASRNVAMTHVAWLSSSETQPYPGDARVLRLARAKCIELGNLANLLAEAWFVQGAGEWSIGNRFAFCRLARNETDTGWQSVE